MHEVPEYVRLELRSVPCIEAETEPRQELLRGDEGERYRYYHVRLAMLLLCLTLLVACSVTDTHTVCNHVDPVSHC